MESLEIYKNDLLHENSKLFAMNSAIKERIKQYKIEVNERLKGAPTVENMKLLGALCGRILGLNVVMKLNNRDISLNLEKLKELKNGTIKEI